MDAPEFDPADRRPLAPRHFGWVQNLAATLAKTGVSPNTISVAGLVAGVVAGTLWSLTGFLPELARLLWLAGILCVVLRILANTLDGLVAVEWHKASRVGLLYNDVPDRLSDTALLLGMGCAQGGDATLGMAAAGVAVFVSYIRLIGRAAGAPSDFCGPMDKGGRMITLMLAALYMGLAPSSWLAPGGITPAVLALALVCAGGLITAMRRLVRANRYLQSGG